MIADFGMVGPISRSFSPSGLEFVPAIVLSLVIVDSSSCSENYFAKYQTVVIE